MFDIRDNFYELLSFENYYRLLSLGDFKMPYYGGDNVLALNKLSAALEHKADKHIHIDTLTLIDKLIR